MQFDKSIQNNFTLIVSILFSLFLSLLYFISIDYALKKEWLEIHTTIIGYILSSLILGFLTVWLLYITIKWFRNRKKK